MPLPDVTNGFLHSAYLRRTDKRPSSGAWNRAPQRLQHHLERGRSASLPFLPTQSATATPFRWFHLATWVDSRSLQRRCEAYRFLRDRSTKGLARAAFLVRWRSETPWTNQTTTESEAKDMG